MKQLLTLGLILVTTFNNLYCQTNYNSNNSSMSNKSDSFKIVIINKYFGRNKHITTITNDSLLIERNVNNSNKYIKETRKITEEEKTEIALFLENFPIADFKSGYYNKGVKDGKQLTFSISINTMQQNIDIANYYIKELGQLVAVIEKLLPEEYYIWYSKEVCPEEIDK